MYFLIEYDREKKELIECTEYENRQKAWDETLKKELALHKQDQNTIDKIEIALFEANSREDLEITHSRYFKSLKYFQRVFKDMNQTFKKYNKDLKRIEKSLNL